VKYFGRHKGGAIRDGVLVAMVERNVSSGELAIFFKLPP
jgi:hypothetical protein